ncbi:class I SAM-dependent methyltransferase [Actinomycetospora chibensis]|uniref:Class I SAM-dependent methyltransferase n=1 Tax=Actinomycetospora chibensis TaxID=663606 RepID=A0ABV9RRX2_9PSEU|nr:class I SAM-dependent methyltransferase [Actinomycetospora chibensis]MDD7926948.1 methyltransferase domain-containing protein [Actinomycetospora chibensis]
MALTSSGSESDTYARNADFWIKIIREGLDRYRTELTDDAVLDAVGPCDGLDVLDAGCGEGYMGRLLAERGARVVGADISDSLVDAARAHEDAERLGLRYEVASLEDLTEPDDSFDLVVCNHVLSDVADPGRALAELGRVLRPGGRLVALMLHPCFYTAHAERDASGSIPVTTYFTERTISQPFNVAGIESPDQVHMNFRPLEFYASALASAGFAITMLSEPHPSPECLKTDDWWRSNFKRPLFLLISAAHG